MLEEVKSTLDDVIDMDAAVIDPFVMVMESLISIFIVQFRHESDVDSFNDDPDITTL
jgi:hypothetical protein